MRKILIVPNPKLREKSRRITDDDFNDDTIKNLTTEMEEVIRHHQASGLAAIQIGEPLAVFGIRFDNDIKFYINPRINTASSQEEYQPEQCLSIPYIQMDIPRPKELKITYTDIDNNEVQTEIEGYEARVYQHELEHLHGYTIIDRLSRLNRDRAIAKIKKIRKKIKHGLLEQK